MTTTPRHVLRRLAVVLAVGVTAALAPSSLARASDPVRDGKIAISDFSTEQIYTLNPDGTDLRLLADHAGNPDWSPDGRRIAFASDATGDDRINTMAADGTDQRLILAEQPGFEDETPRYTPDGNSIVFIRCQSESCAVYSVRLDGTNLTALTPFQDVIDYYPAVSPDGARIAFVRFGAGGIQAQIYVMNADGTNPHPITDPALLASEPNWSPDGRRITFSNCCRLNVNVYDISPRGTHLRQLTHTPYPLASRGSAYSPTGASIVFRSNRDHPDLCCNDLFVMSADGSHQTLVPTGLTDVTHVAWGRIP